MDFGEAIKLQQRSEKPSDREVGHTNRQPWIAHILQEEETK
ncbi:hypothetical protein JOE49_003243 [Paenibacillus sp. PvR133]|nr:hypothetical protein [Paenibacillus sp. PvR133]